MGLIQVDMIHAKPLQRILYGAHNVQARIAAIVWPVAHWIMNLCRHHRLVPPAIGFQGLADNPLTFTPHVAVGCVDHGDPTGQGRVDHPDRLLL